MQTGQPSRTAYRAAAHRAAHQTLEGGRIFADPLATRVLGEAPEAVFGAELKLARTRGMRWLIAARSRFAEAKLAEAVARGVRQYVLLGAGLDTFAHRNPFADAGLRVFEVDHPATQAWKRDRLADAGLTSPASLTFAPVDFERQTLADGLAAAGFDPEAPAMFAWLGVVIYLTRPAVMSTLRYIGHRPVGSAVAFDYSEPISHYPMAVRPQQAARRARLAAMGEPWITRFRPQSLAKNLTSFGFDSIEDLPSAEISRRYYGIERPDGPGAHLICAAKLGSG